MPPRALADAEWREREAALRRLLAEQCAKKRLTPSSAPCLVKPLAAMRDAGSIFAVDAVQFTQMPYALFASPALILAQ
jgi:hypothetical protein